jgi:hypothetical protein
VLERLRFKATASTRFVLGAPRRVGEIQDSLELPVGFNPRTVAWARAFRADPSRRGATATQFAQAVLQHIRTQGFSYTLAPGRLRPRRHRRVLARSQGGLLRALRRRLRRRHARRRRAGANRHRLPGHRPAAVDGYYLVRQSSAHAWAEFWQSGTGWVRADPTGAVAPTASAAATGSRRSRASSPARSTR